MIGNQAHSLTASSEPQKPQFLALDKLDTTRGSIIHRLFSYCFQYGQISASRLVIIYFVTLAVTFVPLLVGAACSPLHLLNPIEGHRLSFLQDWNVLFMCLVSFPCLMILTTTDQYVLSASLRSVQLDGTLSIPETEAKDLVEDWDKNFYITNLASIAAGCIIGAFIAYFNYITYIPKSVGFWIAVDGHLLPVGFIFLCCIFLFYALITVYVSRNIAIAFLFKDVVSRARLYILPLHPDHSGGLHPVGRLGLRNQYVLTLFGLNIVLLVITSVYYLQVPKTLYGLIVAAIVAYLILGPLVFVAPLLPFRGGMLRSKSELLSEVAKRLRVELQRIRGQLQSETISKEDEELIDRLRKIGAVIDELPVWPFDSATVRKFLVAYVVPVLSSVILPGAKFIYEYVSKYIH
jgi:hypothetical protein